MTEHLLEAFIPFIWFIAIGTTVYIFFHRFSDVIKEKFRASSRIHNASNKEKDIDQQFNELIKNAPAIRDQVKTEIEKLKAEGVTDDQLKGLTAKKSMLDFVADNEQIINLIGKPILKRVLGMIKAI